jgi:hypothetical protein
MGSAEMPNNEPYAGFFRLVATSLSTHVGIVQTKSNARRYGMPSSHSASGAGTVRYGTTEMGLLSRKVRVMHRMPEIVLAPTTGTAFPMSADDAIPPRNQQVGN